jgi:tetratricopeptide (TPR) repeat protein
MDQLRSVFDIRWLAVGVSTMLVLAACGGDTATRMSSMADDLEEVMALSTVVHEHLAAGEFDEAMAGLEGLTERFGASTDPEVAHGVALTLYNSGTALYGEGLFDEALTPYQDLVALYLDSTDPTVQIDVADTLFNLGLALHELDRHEDELATFETIDRFHASTDADMAPIVAKALNNKGITLYELERSENEQLAAFDEVISRYGNSTDPNNAPNVARAFYSRGFALEAMELHTDAVDAYEEVISRYGDSDDSLVASFVGAAEQQLYGLEASSTVEPLLHELRTRASYWIGIDDEEILSSAKEICSIAGTVTSAEVFLDRLEESFEEDRPLERIGELVGITKYVEYCDADDDLALLALLDELGQV